MTFDGLRPRKLVVVAGTGTEIGKTWVASRIARDLRATGYEVIARKPAQSFDPGDSSTDAHVLAAATGEEPSAVCPRHRWYPAAMAPPMAAEYLERPPFSIEDLVAEIDWPLPAPDVALVESAGGVRSPLAPDGDTVTLVELLQPDVVLLVADAELGTINSVTMSLEALDRGAHVARPVVVLNRFEQIDELHRRNRDWLADHLGVDVLVTVAGVLAAVRPD